MSAGRITSLSWYVALLVTILVFPPRQLSASTFGPPPNAPLSLEKLSRIDEFLNDQVAQG